MCGGDGRTDGRMGALVLLMQGVLAGWLADWLENGQHMGMFGVWGEVKCNLKFVVG